MVNDENIKLNDKTDTFFKLQKVPREIVDDHSVMVHASFDITGSDKDKSKAPYCYLQQEVKAMASSCNNFSSFQDEKMQNDNSSHRNQQKFKSFMSEFAQKLNLKKSKEAQKSYSNIPGIVQNTETSFSATKNGVLKEINFNIYANMTNNSNANTRNMPLSTTNIGR